MNDPGLGLYLGPAPEPDSQLTPRMQLIDKKEAGTHLLERDDRHHSSPSILAGFQSVPRSRFVQFSGLVTVPG